MKEKSNTISLRPGISVVFNGSSNTLLCEGFCKEYPIGGLIAEYFRFVPIHLKEAVMQCSDPMAEATPDHMANALNELLQNLLNRCLPVPSIMMFVEMCNTTMDWFSAIRESDEYRYITECIRPERGNTTKKFIFENTGYSEYGRQTVLQMLLSICHPVIMQYAVFTSVYLQVAQDKISKNQVEADAFDHIVQMYLTDHQLQDMRFQIILTENGYESFYTIYTASSLLLLKWHIATNRT